jgi:hypothetical protein
MRMNLGWIALGLAVLPQTSFAWKMSGIDGSLSVDSRVGAITLIDSKGNPLVLSSDSQVRMRLSNSSSSLSIMKDPNHIQEIKIYGGFPGNDLRNFSISGRLINQAYDLVGTTAERTNYLGRRTGWESCSYTCGYGLLDRNPPARPINPPARPINPPARPINPRPRPVICQGSRLIEIESYQTVRSFELDFVEPSTRASLAQFYGVADVQNSDTTRVISACR